jgi:hypothetical protein
MLNDFWMYNISSTQWTWISGPTTFDWNIVYGNKGVSSANNMIGNRFGHAMVLNPALNCVYVYGGWGYDQSLNLGKFCFYIMGIMSYSYFERFVDVQLQFKPMDVACW